MKIFRRLYQYVTPYRAWAVLALVSMFVVAASTGALIALVRPLFDDVLSRGEQHQDQKVRDQREVEAERLLLRRDAPAGQRGAVINWIDHQQTRARAWWDAHAHDRWKYILAALMVIFVVRAI